MIGITKLIAFAILTLAGIPSQASSGPACRSVFQEGSQRGEAIPRLLPLVPIESLDAVRAVSRGHFTAQRGSQTVFLKRLRNSLSPEISWLERLNYLGLGAKLYGKTELNGQTFAVLEYVEGINTQMPMMAPPDFKLAPQVVAEIKRQAKLLADHQIIPVDLQFQVSKDGSQVVLIDPELFKVAPDLQTAQTQTQVILQNLFMPWQLEGKIEF